MSKENTTAEQWAKRGWIEVDGKLVKASSQVAKGKIEKIKPLNVETVYGFAPDTPKSDLAMAIGYSFRLPDGERIAPLYTFNIEPCAAPRMSRSDKWKTDPYHKDPLKRQRKPVTKYFNWQNRFNALCDESGYKLTPVLNIVFVVPFPKSYSIKKREQLNGQPHQIRPDYDNLLKAVGDSAGIEDGFLWNVRVIKMWGEKGQIIIF
jgi:Holliday junction resolvase RusA-like endonuclease